MEWERGGVIVLRGTSTRRLNLDGVSSNIFSTSNIGVWVCCGDHEVLSRFSY